MKMLSLLSALLFVIGCTTQHRHVFIHLGDINEDMTSEHVTYQGGVLRIDDETIEIPDGEKLSVRYIIKGESVRFTVKVDGKVVAENAAGAVPE